MNKFTFSSDSIPTWPWWFFLLTGSFVVGLIFLVSNLVHLWFFSSLLVGFLYITHMVCLFSFIFVMSYIFSKSTHVHHYTISLVLMSFCGHHNFLITAVHAFFNGMYIEGSSRWNQDPNWVMKVENVNDDFTNSIPSSLK